MIETGRSRQAVTPRGFHRLDVCLTTPALYCNAMSKHSPTQQQDDFPEYLNDVMDLFMDRFMPVTSIDDATHFLSTEEIFKQLSDLNPGSLVKPVDIYKLLWEAGYRYDIEKNHFSLKFRWMLKEK